VNYSDIQTFLTIASSDSLSKAAEDLYISQPALSHRLTMLESELGTQLIVRKKGVRNIELTESGRRFYKVAKKWEELWQETQAISSGQTNAPLKIASVDSLNSFFMAKVCQRYLLEYPKEQLVLSTMHSNVAYDAVENNEVQLAFVTNPHFFKRVQSIPLFKEPMTFVCAGNDDYNENVNPSELKVEDEIYIPWSNPFLVWHDYWFGTKFMPKVVLDDINLLQSFLRLKNTWSVMPVTIAEMITRDEDLKMIQMQEMPEPRTGYALIDDEQLQNHAVIRFIEKFIETVNEIPDITVLPQWEQHFHA
jgi:DNA-binding transcriptional LysR family regulator